MSISSLHKKGVKNKKIRRIYNSSKRSTKIRTDTNFWGGYKCYMYIFGKLQIDFTYASHSSGYSGIIVLVNIVYLIKNKPEFTKNEETDINTEVSHKHVPCYS